MITSEDPCLRGCSRLIFLPMDKKTAAEKLGVSIRLVERYASEGRLGEVSYVRGKTGKQADYSEEAVERLKQELEAPMTAESTELIKPRTDAQRGLAMLTKLFESVTPEQTRNGGVRTSEMLMLSPKEAAHLSNLPLSFIKAEIKAGRLTATRIGRAQRIKRAELDEFVNNL